MSKIDAKTWNKLMLLGGKQGSIKLTDLSAEIGLNEEDSLSFLRQMFPSGGVESYHHAGDCWIDIDAEAIQYMLPLSPAEWMHLHHVLSSAPSDLIHDEAFHSLKKKVSDQGPLQAVMEMLDQLQLWDNDLSVHEQKFIQLLDQAVLSKQLIKLGTIDEKCYNVFPCKVLHLEGQLSLIAEDLQDHCLMVFPINSLSQATIVASTSHPRVTSFELEEFIGCVRSMNEKETRLILKIVDPSDVNLFPAHHFLGKPCMVTNPNGDLIWAAYVEPCEALFDWIAALGHHVEILDPTKFKEQYFMYCEEKLSKIA